jgi:molybdate transport system substrate-binding protein
MQSGKGMIAIRQFSVFIALLISAMPVHAADPVVKLYAAGSLRAAMTEIAAAYRKVSGVSVETEFGASGLLRQRIEKGEPAQIFASADMGHPEALVRDGRADRVVLFTRNRLCALAQPQLHLTSETLLDVLLNPAVRVGTSTPKNDPSGDYTWTMFEKAEHLRPGAYDRLTSKALQLVGGVDSPAPPRDRTVYAQLMADNKVDIFITYCTNAVLAASEVPGLRTVHIPEALAVGGDYGLTVLRGAGADAERLAQFILSTEGQAVLQKFGFSQLHH